MKTSNNSVYKNINNPKNITITHYDGQGNMWWSKHLGIHGLVGHSSPHWHFEMPHSGPYNSRFKFIIEYLRQLWQNKY